MIVIENSPLFELVVEQSTEQEYELVLEMANVTVMNGTPIHIGSEPPPNPQEGQLWFQI